MAFVKKIPPRRLCLSGGGIKAVSYVGAFEALEEHGFLKQVKEICGVSAGSLIGLSYCLGYTLNELRIFCRDFDFSLIRHLEMENILEFTEKLGFDSGERLLLLLKSVMKQKGFNPLATFADIFSSTSKTRLRVYATDMNTCTIREFSLQKTPTVPIVEAVRASMSLPFYFIPFPDPITGHLLSDGGLINNYPMEFLNRKEQEESLGFVFSIDHIRRETIDDLFIYLNQMHGCMYLGKKNTSKNTIVLPEGHFPSWNFEATAEERVHLMEQGKKTTLQWLRSSEVKEKIPRRFSVS
jgi:NTE family protein